MDVCLFYAWAGWCRTPFTSFFGLPRPLLSSYRVPIVHRSFPRRAFHLFFCLRLGILIRSTPPPPSLRRAMQTGEALRLDDDDDEEEDDDDGEE